MGKDSAAALLPCPFCGDSVILTGLGGWHEVVCTNCNATSRYTRTEAEAVAAWNDRTTAPDLLAALEAALDMLVEVVTYTDTPDVENDPVWRDIHGRGADCLRTARAAIAKATGG